VALAGFHDDVAATAAVAALRAAARDVLLAPESEASVAAVTGLYANFGFIYEHGLESRRWLLVVGLWPSATRLSPKGKSLDSAEASKALRKFECLLCFERLNHYELAHLSAIHELNAACDFGEERVVFALADVQAGFHTGAALPNDDGTAGDKLSAECLKAKPLRVGVASVS
jgi:hypothetical protein